MMKLRRIAPLVLMFLTVFALAARADDAPGEARRSRFEGSAYLARNRPLVGATVLVSKEDDASVLYVTATDGDGRFRFDGLADGSYRVEVRREGYETVIKSGIELRLPIRPVIELAMRAGESARAAARPPGGGEPAVLRGTVSERGAGPVADVTLQLSREDGSSDPRAGVSAGGGVFEFAELPPGVWDLVVRGVGYLSLRAPLDIRQDTRLELVLVRQPTDYEPSPFDLMPAEEPIAPAGFDVE